MTGAGAEGEGPRGVLAPLDGASLSEAATSRVTADPGAVRDAARAMRECVLAWEAYRLGVAGFLGVTLNESLALSFLVGLGAMPVSRLGALMGFTSGATSLMVDRLEAKALIVRTRDATDRRRVILEASAEAQQRLPDVSSWLTVAFAEMTTEEVVRSSRTFEHVAAQLREFAELLTGATRGSR